MVPREGMGWFDRLGEPERILLTNRHHLRESERFAEAYGCPILCHADGPARVRRRAGRRAVRAGRRAGARACWCARWAPSRPRRSPCTWPTGPGRARRRRRRPAHQRRRAGLLPGPPARGRPRGGQGRPARRLPPPARRARRSTSCCSPTATRCPRAAGRRWPRSPPGEARAGALRDRLDRPARHDVARRARGRAPPSSGRTRPRCSARASTSARAAAASSIEAAKISVSAASRMRSCSLSSSLAGPRSPSVLTTRPYACVRSLFMAISSPGYDRP